jgi:hypothetical protein
MGEIVARITFSHDRCACGHRADEHLDDEGGSGGDCSHSEDGEAFCACTRFVHGVVDARIQEQT